MDNSCIDNLVAVTGGIGSGKSVVCRVLSAMGYPVYDCDSRAKHLMDSDMDIKKHLSDEIDSRVVRADGVIDRPLLARIVFSDPSALARLNRITHQAVRTDLSRWVQKLDKKTPAFVETAIAVESGIDQMVAEVWNVVAPRQVRVERVMRRSGINCADVEKRIDAQLYSDSTGHPNEKTIINDGHHAILPEILELTKSLMDRLESVR